jgi:diaminopimelate decarboxylase
MADKTVPFDREFAERVASDHPTPFHIYDEAAIRARARTFIGHFDWVPGGFKNYYAAKALPNPHILKILKDEGMGFDCSSMPEMMLAERIGSTGEEIMFTSNDTPAYEYAYAKKLGAVINLDDVTHIDYLNRHVGMPNLLCMRYNPGPLKEGNFIIGKPEEAKYGFTKDQILEGYKKAASLGTKRFGLHAMVASNELNADYFVDTADLLFELALEIHDTLGIAVEFINLGGGIGIPYRPEESEVDMARISAGIRELYEKKIEPTKLHPVRIVMENGRYVTGPHGFLVTRVIHKKDTYKSYVGLDGNMANLMRPGMYGAYHHITVLGKESSPRTHTCDVTGSLCENNDKFAIDRALPEVEVGDLLVIHDTGAHGHAMGFNYNGKLRSAELLLTRDGGVRQIRRAETVDDYFATLDFATL